jgi:metallo-beta-lactamase class B
MQQLTGLICAILLALFLVGSFSNSHVSAQSGQVHGAPPGGHKSSLKSRFLWNVKPLHIIGNVYFVGMSGGDFDAYLITSPKGHFLIDAGPADQVKKSIEQLGFKVTDIKYILEEHAHNDHVVGLADMKQMSGAKVLAMPGDIPPLEDGGVHENFLPDMDGPVSPPVKVDGQLHDGQKLELGSNVVVAHLTAGHTPGCSTFTTEQEENGKKYNVVIYGACSPMNQPLIGNKDHPTIVQAFTNQYRTLRQIHGDILLGVGTYDQMAQNAEQRDKNPGTDPFIDPKRYDDFVAKTEDAFLTQLRREIDTGEAWPINIGEGKPCPPNVSYCSSVYDLVMKCCAKYGAKYVGKD